MIRSSRLNTAEFCGLAGSYEERTTGEWALAGQAFHAGLRGWYRPTFENVRAADVALAAVKPEVRDGIRAQVADLAASWTPPPTARFEVPIALDFNGRGVAYD